jgi:hypothetical protein
VVALLEAQARQEMVELEGKYLLQELRLIMPVVVVELAIFLVLLAQVEMAAVETAGLLQLMQPRHLELQIQVVEVVAQMELVEQVAAEVLV